jgi:hypothetical protein
MNEYLTFDKFITPVIIQIIFWIGLAGIVIMALLAIVNGAALQGLLLLIFGPIVLRIYTEILLVAFKMLEELQEIRKQGARP